jgi:tryptophan synthase alpha subunit
VGRLADGVVVGSAVVRAADRDINAALSLVREMRTSLDQLP